MSAIFRRPALARQMAQQLLHPSVLDEGLRSGLFLSGLRRTGKSTFLRNDLIPTLEAEGALVIYVDLWSDTRTSAAALVHAEIRKTLENLQTPASVLWKKLQRAAHAEVGIPGFKFDFDIAKVGETGGTTLAQALTEVVDQAKTNVVMIIDEVQHAITSDEGNNMLLALKAARDAINQRPATPGHFLFIGTGSHRALVNELSTRRNQAFAGAKSVAYPVLGAEYVQYVLERLASESPEPWPSLEVTVEAFRTLGNRPEELLSALREWHNLPKNVRLDPDQVLPVIARTLRSRAADLELRAVEDLGALAVVIFERIASEKGEARGLFSAEALADYARAIGRDTRVEEVQPLLNEMVKANVIMRTGHGLYGVTDPFVQEVWREKKSLTAGL